MNFTEDTTPITSPQAQGSDSVPKPLRRRRKSSSPKWLRKLKRRFNLRLQFLKVLIMIVVVLVVIAVGSLVLVTDATNRVESSLSSLNRVIASISNRPGTELTLNDFNRLQSSINDVIATFSSVQRQIGFLRPLVSLDKGVEATVTSLDAAQQLALSADAMLDGLQPTLFFLVGGQDDETVVAQISSGERIVELLRLGRPSFISAQDYLQTAERSIQSIQTGELSASMLLQVEELNAFHQQLTELQVILMAAPDLLTAALGLETQQNYLVLSQNSDEIRPSGGYLSTYGWMTVRNGRVTDYSYSATTATSPNPPSSESDIPIPDWWIQYGEPIYAAWDGSWSPDFPTTANMAMWYYNAGNNPQSPVSGAISIDIVAFEYILEALGQVIVPEYNSVVTTSNFRQVVYDIRAFGEGDAPHKRFLAALYRQIFSDWQATASDPQTSGQILGVLLRALQEKHIMLYFADENLNNAVELLGWAGGQESGIGRDYLMVVDANLGNKSNSSIRRQMTYDVQINPDGSVASRTTVLYDYPSTVADADPAVNPEFHGPIDYNNLLQVYVPTGAVVTDTTGAINQFQVVEQTNHSLLTGQLTVPYDGSERFQFSYNSPSVIESLGEYQRYRLLIQKQPGMRPELVNVQVTLPIGATVVSISPETVASYSLDRQILEFRFELTGDVELEIVYQLPSAETT